MPSVVSGWDSNETYHSAYHLQKKPRKYFGGGGGGGGPSPLHNKISSKSNMHINMERNSKLGLAVRKSS